MEIVTYAILLFIARNVQSSVQDVLNCLQKSGVRFKISQAYKRLRHLEKDQLIISEDCHQIPPIKSYRITVKGKQIRNQFAQLLLFDEYTQISQTSSTNVLKASHILAISELLSEVFMNKSSSEKRNQLILEGTKRIAKYLQETFEFELF